MAFGRLHLHLWIKLWQPRQVRLVRTDSCLLNCGANHVVGAAGDKTVRLWSLGDWACLRTFEGHLASVLCISFLSAGTQLLSAGADGLVKLWNFRLSGKVFVAAGVQFTRKCSKCGVRCDSWWWCGSCWIRGVQKIETSCSLWLILWLEETCSTA